MPWWWRHAARALALCIAVGMLGSWAMSNHDVLEALAGLATAGILLGGLWLIGGAADDEMKRRRSRDNS